MVRSELVDCVGTRGKIKKEGPGWVAGHVYIIFISVHLFRYVLSSLFLVFFGLLLWGFSVMPQACVFGLG